MWKNIASFVLGFVIGGAAVYFFTKDEMEKEQQTAIDSVKDYYKKTYESKEKETLKRLEKEKSEMAAKIFGYQYDEKKEESENERPEPTKVDIPAKKAKKHDPKEKEDYAGMYRPRNNFQKEDSKDIIRRSMNEYLDELEETENEEPEEDDEEDISDYYPDENYHPEDEGAEKPYKISESEFANGRLYYDKSDLLWYEDNDVLVDTWRDEVIEDISNVVGKNFKMFFDEDDPDLAYVRNESTGSDYSIQRIHGAYIPEAED